MASSYVATNLQTQDYRTTVRPAPVSREQKVAHLRRWLAERSEQAWRESYKAAAQELAVLETE